MAVPSEQKRPQRGWRDGAVVKLWCVYLFMQKTQVQFPAPMWWLTTAHNSSSKGSNIFWSPGHTAFMWCTVMHTHKTSTHKTIKKGGEDEPGHPQKEGRKHEGSRFPGKRRDDSRLCTFLCSQYISKDNLSPQCMWGLFSLPRVSKTDFFLPWSNR